VERLVNEDHRPIMEWVIGECFDVERHTGNKRIVVTQSDPPLPLEWPPATGNRHVEWANLIVPLDCVIEYTLEFWVILTLGL